MKHASTCPPEHRDARLLMRHAHNCTQQRHRDTNARTYSGHMYARLWAQEADGALVPTAVAAIVPPV